MTSATQDPVSLTTVLEVCGCKITIPPSQLESAIDALNWAGIYLHNPVIPPEVQRAIEFYERTASCQ